MCDADPLRSFAAAHRLDIIEDAAQAHGARTAQDRAGAIGRAAAFSFYPGKNLGAAGDGGAVTTSDAEVAARAAALRSYGSPRKHEHPMFGINSRLDALQAALLEVKLRHIEDWNHARRRLAAAYEERLRGIDAIVTPEIPADESHVFHLYVVRVPAARRDEWLQMLAAAGIGASIHYPTPVPFLGAVGGVAERGDFPVAERLAGEILSLPIYPEMAEASVDRVCETLRRAAVR
jgi:dTDP-4-amino-4,6-dideoxygalactose transaminase